MEDLLEVVDEHDTPTGELLTKRELHERKMPHRCVAVYVFAPDGRMYVQEHQKSGNRLDQSVGGHVERGESYEAAAYRELSEELGIEGCALTEIVTSYYAFEGDWVHVYGLYLCTAPDNWQFKPTEEVAKIHLMSIEEIVEQMNAKGLDLFVNGFVKTMEKYLEVTGSKLKVAVKL